MSHVNQREIKLYDLPKDILVKLLITIENDTKKEQKKNLTNAYAIYKRYLMAHRKYLSSSCNDCLKSILHYPQNHDQCDFLKVCSRCSENLCLCHEEDVRRCSKKSCEQRVYCPRCTEVCAHCLKEYCDIHIMYCQNCGENYCEDDLEIESHVCEFA